MKTIWSLIEKNRGFVVAAVLAACLMVVGCVFRAKTESPFTNQPVTKEVLDTQYADFLKTKQRELDDMAAKVTASQADLERKQAVIDDITELANSLAASVPGPWGGLLTAGLGLLSGGGIYDAVRRRRVIGAFKDALKTNGIEVPRVNP